MSVKLVPPASPRSSRVKACAFHAFRVVRFVQTKAIQAPGVIAQARNDIAAAWQESDVGANGRTETVTPAIH